MATINDPGSSEHNSSFNRGDVIGKRGEDEGTHSPKGKEDRANVPLHRIQAPGTKDKGVQYLVLSVVGYVCATIVFGFLLNKRGKESDV